MRTRANMIMCVFSLLSLVWLGCDSGNDSERKSRRGETCSYSNDCKNTLACVLGVCVQDEYPIAVEAKSCVLIECRNDDECCGPSTVTDDCRSKAELCAGRRAVCDGLQNDCNAALAQCREDEGDVCTLSLESCVQGDSQACEIVNNNCAGCFGGISRCTQANMCSDEALCNAADDACACRNRCDDNRCVQIRAACDSAGDCPSGICLDGECVACRTDDDCGDGRVCEDGGCIAACRTSNDCPLFSTCDDGHCEYTGCKSNRECVLFTGSGAAVCLDGECIEPCQGNSQCGPLQACVQARCTFLGCEEDIDCRALADGRYAPGIDGSRGNLECVDSSDLGEGTQVIIPVR